MGQTCRTRHRRHPEASKTSQGCAAGSQVRSRPISWVQLRFRAGPKAGTVASGAEGDVLIRQHEELGTTWISCADVDLTFRRLMLVDNFIRRARCVGPSEGSHSGRSAPQHPWRRNLPLDSQTAGYFLPPPRIRPSPTLDRNRNTTTRDRRRQHVAHCSRAPARHESAVVA
jgi:hypothetical protein